MPKIAELRVIDGQTWARVEINGDPGIITLWTEDEKKAAIRDYLLALPEDKETVERVARGIDENAFLVPSYQDPRNREVNIQRRKTAMRQALRAITALTATGR